MIKNLILLFAFVCGFAFCQDDTNLNLSDEAPTGFQSVTTSLDFDDCLTLDLSTWYNDAHIDFFTQECPALLGYQVFMIGGDLRSWLVLGRAEERFVFRDDVWQALGGSFPYVSGSLLEWRFLWADGLTMQVVAVIYRMARQDTKTLEDRSALVVLRMTEQSPCFLGLAPNNEEARALADDLTQTCSAE